MKRPDEERLAFVDQWLRKADADLIAAERLQSDDDDARLSEVIAFHCQQATEKYLKAFLVWHKVEFPKTHDLERLRHLVSSVNRELSELLRIADVLTPFGVDGRYPGDGPEVPIGGESELVELARFVRTTVAAALDSN